ncbi:hypothetical protein ZIOFF_010610 [Zingiber officinale]|uniref:LITAF domain-containing protein n=1 Tax=Zingiber officinale TaxID=94328 RepID=A0A8J5HPA4_ZINOF|nr:hypothetical protein ZIOFF_010610 [Zingiber officinale]
MATKGKEGEPALGVPYGYAYGQEAPQPQPQPQPQVYYGGQNPYQAGAIPPNAVYGDPKGIPLQQTMYRDTPAPFQCVFCGSSGLTTVRLKQEYTDDISVIVIATSFLAEEPEVKPLNIKTKPGSCCWLHDAIHAGSLLPLPIHGLLMAQVADFEKSDPCLVMDPPHWQEMSFAVPA